MSTDNPPDDSIVAELRELRETVTEQQARIDELEAQQPEWQPSRRAVVGGIAGVLGLGAAIPYMSQPAAAQAVGQLGGPSERIDVFGETVDATAASVGTLEADAILSELQNGSDVSSSRSFETIYENTTNSDIIVYATSSALGTGENGELIASVRADSSFGFGDRIDRDKSDGDTAIANSTVCFRVPQGYFYKIITGGDIANSDVLRWNERGLKA